MEGNAKIIRLIARDEALHLTGTQHMLNLLRSGADDAQLLAAIRETIWQSPGNTILTTVPCPLPAGCIALEDK